MRKINVAIADQHFIIRLGLKGILNRSQRIMVSHVAENPKELFKQISHTLLKPDVIIIDYNLAQTNEFETSLKIKKVLPKCKILFLTDTESRYLIMKQIPSHAHGFINKSYSTKFLQQKIQMIYEN